MRRIIILLLSVLALAVSCSTTAVVFDVHSPVLEEYLSSPFEMATVYAKGQKENGRPEKIHISWKGEEGKEYTFLLSTDEDFSSYREYLSDTNSIDLENLFIGTTYFWKIEGTSESGSFRVSAHAPRVIDVDGVTNFRDVGGWNDSIRQGLLYRSARLSENRTGEPLITEKGRKTFVEELGIRTEVDLRDTKDNEYGSLSSSAAGEGVKYIHYPMKSGGNCLLLNIGVLPGLFEILADESNYPLVYHCSIGCDRTGVVSFLVNGLLGVSEENLYRDYLVSNFALVKVMRTPSAIDDYIDYMERYSGETLSERIEAFLLDAGVEAEDISAFREIMLEN